MGRPTKENSLTQQDVITAAIACLDREGESALGVNRVARELGIKPPAIYKHLDGNPALKRAVALALWQDFLAFCQPRSKALSDSKELLKAGGRATRDYARSHPARYKVMMQFQLQPSDPEASAIIQETLDFFRRILEPYEFTSEQLVDAMRMVNATVNGFIALEQGKMLTLERSTDASFEVMLEALVVAIEHIRNVEES
ncbi:TetR/AcrR family transcriptional regulator [Chroococcidiopsis thermalis]|jgi:AcrR family transcriptional regulator|uniref:Transcriptional regulator, TetR family n=1 Tax=Chroococcidiopsis thermalis (strain PCC 7203) TaxID=251229 RepID=K9TZS4_CHRTP|nr:TetR/AcrR family transcriptional regulator [Chroococcidiopsis thermalis]AFY87499.1 transcriptional regulator, TetR family [Chroococcidiopsis thermalis PCC 7203]PSB46187.1 TetR/AcrR family transcriptional regulator [Cyanosarcina cf. burmensis CCALA 770]